MFNRKIKKLEGPMGDQIETSKREFSPVSSQEFIEKHPKAFYWTFVGILTSLALSCSLETDFRGIKGFYRDSKNFLGFGKKPVPQHVIESEMIERRSEIFNQVAGREPKQETLESKLRPFELSNEIFTDKDYLTKDQIQNLLNDYNSCLKDKNTAQIIINTAEQYRINPLVLLVKLQQEQGLISKQVATEQEFKYATGYGCFDDKEWKASNGLQEQIEKAAKCFRKHYDSFKQGETIKIDEGEEIITAENAAEAALLHYTPWTDGKNLFIRLAKQYTNEINSLKPKTRTDILQSKQNTAYRKESN